MQETTKFYVWDIPVRLFHWSLVGLVALCWFSAEQGGNWMTVHLWSGYTVLALLLFRILWGLWGSTSARFTDFVCGPYRTWCYARDLLRLNPPFYIGHNPLGGWSVVFLLAALFIQASTGLFANDDIFIEGPLYNWVSKDTSDWLTKIHKLNFNGLLALIGLHLSAILFYRVVKRENLVLPMITGYKTVNDQKTLPAYQTANLGLALFFLITSGIAVYFLVR